MSGNIVNKKQLAIIFDISERTFTEYQKLEGFPIQLDAGRGSENQYNTAKVHLWLIQKALAGNQKESATERLNRIKADREEVALLKDIEQVVIADDVEKELSDLALNIRRLVLASNRVIKAELDELYGIEIDIKILDEHSRSVLENLSAIADESEEIIS